MLEKIRKVFEEKLNELYKRSATCIRSIVRKREEAHERYSKGTLKFIEEAQAQARIT